MHMAMKVVIITERVILDGVTDLIEANGGSGYTHMSAGGKGSRGVRSQNRAHVGGMQANVKIETIVKDQATAEAIAEAVAARYFDNFSGITYIEQVQIVRPNKFSLANVDREHDESA